MILVLFPGSVTYEKKAIPWRDIASSKPLWALVAAQVGHDWGFFSMVTDLPKYMKDVLRFNVSENGVWSSVPYIVMWIVSIGSGWLCDWLIKRGTMSITYARKFFTTLGKNWNGCYLSRHQDPNDNQPYK